MPEFRAVGKCSFFGGALDMGMRPTEGVALYQPGDPDPFGLFRPGQVGSGRGLNYRAYYCAMRWDYEQWGGKSALRKLLFRVISPKTGTSVDVRPVDWGPAPDTGRLIDLSPAAGIALAIATDDTVLVIGPVPPPLFP